MEYCPVSTVWRKQWPCSDNKTLLDFIRAQESFNSLVFLTFYCQYYSNPCIWEKDSFVKKWRVTLFLLLPSSWFHFFCLLKSWKSHKKYKTPKGVFQPCYRKHYHGALCFRNAQRLKTGLQGPLACTGKRYCLSSCSLCDFLPFLWTFLILNLRCGLNNGIFFNIKHSCYRFLESAKYKSW